MSNVLVTIFLFLNLSLNALFASEKDYGKLTEISLQEGLTKFQKEAVNISGFIENLKAHTDKSFALTILSFDLLQLI